MKILRWCLILPSLALAQREEIHLPLMIRGQKILDARESNFRFRGVNWYGFESKDFVAGGLHRRSVAELAHTVRTLGFNAVRLPWSNEMVRRNPVIADDLLTANPNLRGSRAIEVFDAVVESLSKENLLIVLDNHSSDGDWCCSDSDENGLWWNRRYSEADWIYDWEFMARRYRDFRAVVGMDLRNEPRTQATWKADLPQWDWGRAVEKASKALLRIGPSWLIFVEGTRYSSDFSGAKNLAANPTLQGRLVYSPHDYSWFHQVSSYRELEAQLDRQWGNLASGNSPGAAPIVVGEFGTCNDKPGCFDESDGSGRWFQWFMRYLNERGFGWIYWPLNGTQMSGTGRTLFAVENFGLLDEGWAKPSSPMLLDKLRAGNSFAP